MSFIPSFFFSFFVFFVHFLDVVVALLLLLSLSIFDRFCVFILFYFILFYFYFQVFGNLEVSHRETEGADDMADDLIYPEDLEFDSDADSDRELGDNSSIKSQDKPKLR